MRTALWLLALALALGPAAASGQSIPGLDPGASVRTRADLERLLAAHEAALASPAYSESAKRAIRTDADAVRARLRDGDFRPGDRIVLYVQGEPELPDTVVVQPGPLISLPLFGDVPLDGVLRSEITQHLTEALGRYIRNPVVRATGHMRVSVLGAVVRPGFYTMPAETLIGEALMVAGGPLPIANIGSTRVERGTEVVLGGEALQDAIRAGMTLDQLNLVAGDQILVPERAAGGFLGTLGIIAGVVGSVGTVLFLILR